MKKLLVIGLFAGLPACGTSDSKVERPIQGSQIESGSGDSDAAVHAGSREDTTVPAQPGEIRIPDSPSIETGTSESITLSFHARVGKQGLVCSDRSEAALAEAQVFNDIRMFISNLSFVDGQGREHRLQLDQAPGSSNLQYVDAANNSIALLNFLAADCAKSDATATVKTTITGLLPQGVYKEIRFQFGLPYTPQSPELAAMPAALAPSDMGWMWRHFPADFQIEMNKGTAGKVMLNALTGKKKRQTVLPLSFALSTTAGHSVSIDLDLSRLFPTDGRSFVNGLEGTCHNGDKIPSEAEPNCAHAFRALGLEVSGLTEHLGQTVFSVNP